MRKCCFYTLIFVPFFVNAQRFQGNVFSGAMFSHTQKLEHLLPTLVNGFSVSAQKPFRSSELKNTPDVGVTFCYSKYSNEIVGSTFGLHFYEVFYLNKSRSLNFKIGTGAGYQTNPYDSESNRLNNVFGSHITFNMHLGFEARIIKIKQMDVNTSLMLQHYSNGAFKLPNLGINYLALGLSFGYNASEKELKHKQLNVEEKKGLVYRTTFYSGMHETLYRRNQPKPFYNVGVSVEKPLSKSFLVGGTIDYYNSRSLKYELEVLGRNDYQRVSLGSVFRLKQGKRLSSLIQLGYYLYSGDFFASKSYFRLHTLYDISKRVYVSVGVKTHRFIAESFELGVGLKLKG